MTIFHNFNVITALLVMELSIIPALLYVVMVLLLHLLKNVMMETLLMEMGVRILARSKMDLFV